MNFFKRRRQIVLALAVMFGLLGCGGGGGGSSTAEVQTSGGSVVTKQAVVESSAECPNGGFSLDTGIDMNGNGILDAPEVSRTEMVCNGQDGLMSLISMGDEPTGDSCALGGKRFEYGLDDNRNGILESAEIDGTSYACNAGAVSGTGESDGLSTLFLSSQEPPGGNCSSGGVKLVSGLDSNRNGTLDAVEIGGLPSYVCNGEKGADGTNALLRVAEEAAGTNCPYGGQKIEAGVDDNGDGILSIDEVDQTNFVCNGAAGPPGSVGGTSLINLVDEAPGDNCAEGGKRIETGIDGNANGTLDAEEVDRIDYVCNGTSDAGALQMVGRWNVLSYDTYNYSHGGGGGILTFYEDNTFTLEGEMNAFYDIAACYTTECTVNTGTWEVVEDDILMLTPDVNKDSPSFLLAHSNTGSQITFTRGNALSIFKRVEAAMAIPVANAGPSQQITLGETVTLDGTESSDANNDALKYKWYPISGPESVSTLSDPTSATPTFTPAASGDYVFALTVSDGYLQSIADTVKVTVASPWRSLADELGYTDTFSPDTLGLTSQNLLYSNSYYGGSGAIVIDYANASVDSIKNSGWGYESLAIDPRDENHYVKLGQNSFWASFDAGVTWKQIAGSEVFGSGSAQIDSNVKYLKYSPDGEALYVYSNGSSQASGGSWHYAVSFDDGVTWSVPADAPPVLASSAGYGPVFISEQDPTKVFLLSPYAVYRSADRGLNWENVSPSASLYNITAFAVDPFNADVAYIQAMVLPDSQSNSQPKLLKTADRGNTWSEVSLPTDFNYLNSISLNRSVNSLVYVFGMSQEGQFAYRSTDGGATWSKLNDFYNLGLPESATVKELVSGPPDAAGKIDLYAIAGGQIYHYIDQP